MFTNFMTKSTTRVKSSLIKFFKLPKILKEKEKFNFVVILIFIIDNTGKMFRHTCSIKR